jgi:hypothetical protein
MTPLPKLASCCELWKIIVLIWEKHVCCFESQEIKTLSLWDWAMCDTCQCQVSGRHSCTSSPQAVLGCLLLTRLGCNTMVPAEILPMSLCQRGCDQHLGFICLTLPPGSCCYWRCSEECFSTVLPLPWICTISEWANVCFLLLPVLRSSYPCPIL